MEPKMTSSSRTNRASATGFTLVELLVVMGIILVLMGLALPMITRVYRNGVRARMQSDLQVIASAIDAYKADFKDIPRTDNADTVWSSVTTNGGSATAYKDHLRGACTLCWCLVAMGNANTTAYNGNTVTKGYDGANGPGFRVRTTDGQIYGPYINPDHIKVALISGGTAGDNHYYYFADTYGNPYLYYPANTGATITNANGYIASTSAGFTPMFDTDDNDTTDAFASFTTAIFARSPADTNTSWPAWRFEVMLGDINHNGQIDTTTMPPETPVSVPGYILWGLGPDGNGGPDDPTNASIISQCDDVTNFQ
jgi:prepilin-type N-terminal cleavage/methylation domain-containing protein